jgi:hypothetical protein
MAVLVVVDAEGQLIAHARAQRQGPVTTWCAIRLGTSSPGMLV